VVSRLLFWQRTGLDVVVQHYTLRFWLWHTFPWKTQQFLDDATARILLKRVGGYSFYIDKSLTNLMCRLLS
jgi:23S rRNA G2069 N7-methylase RlmK/C1962 C5-methylase RlmI